MQIYLNGRLKAVRNFSSTYEYTKNLRIGYTDSEDNAFSGIIDDVRIYNRALSDAEAKQLFHEGGW